MPVKEFNKSVKAKLYDFTYTPFMSSMVIAWIILNHKYILIYMASFDLDKKLELLKNYDFSWHTQWFDIPCMQNIIAPILFGLFYTFIYPKISKKFYEYTLNEKKELKKVKQKIEELTPILEEDAKAIKADNYEKTKKIFDLEESISKVENKHLEIVEVLEEKYNEQIQNIKSVHQTEIKDSREEIRKNLKNNYTQKINGEKKDYEDAYKQIEEKNNNVMLEMDKYKLVNKTLKDQNKKLIKQNDYLQQFNLINKVSEKVDDKSKILKYFYNSNYKTSAISIALDGIVDSTKIPRPKVSKIISELISENILEKNHNGYLFITDTGNVYLVKKFDNE